MEVVLKLSVVSMSNVKKYCKKKQAKGKNTQKNFILGSNFIEKFISKRKRERGVERNWMVNSFEISFKPILAEVF